jgi:hypothetical protein
MCHKLCAKCNESDKIFHLTKNMQNEKECTPQCLIENWNLIRKLHGKCSSLLNILFEEGYVCREEIDSYLSSTIDSILHIEKIPFTTVSSKGT